MYPVAEIVSLLVVMTVTSVAELALHYFPWQMMLNKPLEAPWSYVVGVLAMLGPYTLLLVWWSLFPPQEGAFQWSLAALIGVVFSSGSAVLGAYWLDDYLLAKRKVNELSEVQQSLEEMTFEQAE